MIKIVSHLNQPVYWITPARMKVYSSPVKMTSKTVKTSILKSSKPVTLNIPSEQYDYIEIERKFLANLIHSLDASNIHLLI